MSTPNRWRAWLAATFAGALTVGLTAVGITVAAPAAQAQSVDPNAYYEIVSRHSGKAIDICNVSTAGGACVQQWARSGGENQQFRFLDSGGGYYRIQARHSGKVLDVNAASTDDGADVIQWPWKDTTNQKWRFDLV
jgi:endo-1,4-beta-xylanase